jgi:D-sedoheptulose 7-phosphate isomerase
MSTKQIAYHFEEALEILKQFLSDPTNLEKIEHAGNLMVQAVKNGKKIMSCGNGGSMCDAMHFAEEMTGRYRHNRHALPAISLSDASHMSCVANDFGYEYIFSRFVDGIGQEGDVLLAISTSGNSQNVVNAIESARKKGISVVALTGKDGGKIAGMADVEIRAPHSQYADRAQEIHIKVIHSLIDYVELKINVTP